jgi:hypothetical protein
MHRSRNVLLAVVVAGVTLLVGPADAKVRAKLKAVISGKHFKANVRKSITGAVSSAGFSLAGTAVHGRRVQNLAFACGGVNLASASLPVTVDCTGSYGDAKASLRGSVIKGWGADHGMTFVVTSFADGAVKGTFTGSLPAGDTNPNDPPATFTNGAFTAQLLPTGF